MTEAVVGPLPPDFFFVVGCEGGKLICWVVRACWLVAGASLINCQFERKKTSRRRETVSRNKRYRQSLSVCIPSADPVGEFRDASHRSKRVERLDIFCKDLVE